MDLREQIARAIADVACGTDAEACDTWPEWLNEADAVLEVLAQKQPVAWINAQRDMTYLYGPYHHDDIPLYLAPGAQASVPDGWIRAIDEEMVGAHIGVANAEDDYATAKEKINRLICWHVAVATDPAVNGGLQLVPIEPIPQMLTAAINVEVYPDSPVGPGCLTFEEAKAIYQAMLSAAPKPEGK